MTALAPILETFLHRQAGQAAAGQPPYCHRLP